ncbi:hypothetical protein ABZ942_28985 [Nocardia sp. NPDC046473]|uniref:hypothetical protein n=1 Tax=Nocardia sp. NPDC046473 TaxID=3155733 RepID=UPI0033F84AEE
MADTSSTGDSMGALKAACLGAVAAVVLAPLAAAIVAIVYRFPVPLGEYARGFGGAGSAALGSLFYLLFGGVLVVGILGAAGGFVAARSAGRDTGRALRRTLAVAAIVALLGAITLSVLEFFVGPW